MSDSTQVAHLGFKDEGPQNNPIISIVILHTSLKKGTKLKEKRYVNPNGSANPFSLYKWSKNHPMDFTGGKDGENYLNTYKVTIDKYLHDVWAVAFQRRNNKHVEYLYKVEGFWRKVEEGVAKAICDVAIDVIEVFDDEATTQLLHLATDKLIHEMFTRGDGDVMMDNWVHWDSPKITFDIGEKKAKIHSPHHSTHCAPEEFVASISRSIG